MPFVPRFVFTPAAPPSTETRLPRCDSESHITSMNTVVQHESERYVFAFNDRGCQLTLHICLRPWLAETINADDIAFLIYFGLIDLPLA